MPYYLVQAAYTPESWGAQIKAQPDLGSASMSG